MFPLVNLTRAFTAVQSHVLLPTLGHKQGLHRSWSRHQKFWVILLLLTPYLTGQEPSHCVVLIIALSGLSWD